MKSKANILRENEANFNRRNLIEQSRIKQIKLSINIISLKEKMRLSTPGHLAQGEFADQAQEVISNMDSEGLFLLLEKFYSLHRRTSPGHFSYFSLFSNKLELQIEELLLVVNPILEYTLDFIFLKDELILQLIYGFLRRVRDKIEVRQDLQASYSNQAFKMLIHLTQDNSCSEDLHFLLVDSIYSLAKQPEGIREVSQYPIEDWARLANQLENLKFLNRSLKKKLFNMIKKILMPLPLSDSQASSRIEARFLGIRFGFAAGKLDLPTWLYILWEENWRFMNEEHVQRWLDLARRRPLETKKRYLISPVEQSGPSCLYLVLTLFKKSMRETGEIHFTVFLFVKIAIVRFGVKRWQNCS